MNWQIFIAMVVAIPIILLPVAFLWYLNIGGIFNTVKARRANKEKNKQGK
jgi:hypothetical protein